MLSHTCPPAGRWLGSVTGCKRSPSLSSFTSLSIHFLPPYVPLSWGAHNSDKRAQGPKSLSFGDNRPLTACLWGTTTPRLYVFISLHTVTASSLLTFFFFLTLFLCFPPLSVTQAADSNTLLSSWLFQLALRSAPIPKPETCTRELNVCNHPRGCSGGRPQAFCVKILQEAWQIAHFYK